MKIINVLGLILAMFTLSSFVIKNTTLWKITDDYAIKFEAKKVSGSFETFSGDIVFDDHNLGESICDLRIDVASIKTGNFLKNKHAKGSKWFDVKSYPLIHFKSSEFSQTSSGYEVSGILEMHGTKQKITIPFSFNNNTFKSSFTIDRTDFNLGGTTGMQGSVGHIISLDIAIPVTQN